MNCHEQCCNCNRPQPTMVPPPGPRNQPSMVPTEKCVNARMYAQRFGGPRGFPPAGI